jgi:hypothetical protein
VNSILIRFYAELNDLLLLHQKQVAFKYCFSCHPAIKDVIEPLGVPHTEVVLILVDGESVGCSRQVQGRERVSVYPAFGELDLAGLISVQPEPLPAFRFVLNVHLGRLASYLRMVGFDTVYRNKNSLTPFSL